MFLSKIKYYEFPDQLNYWEIDRVLLQKQNLIVGMNSTGKSRLLNVINNLAKLLLKRAKFDGNWSLEFVSDSTPIMTYELRIQSSIIQYERIVDCKSSKVLLSREKSECHIFSNERNEYDDITPPEEELVLYVRRDLKHYPYLEDIIQWANNLYGYQFSTVHPNSFGFPQNKDLLLEDLTAAPYLLNELATNADIVQSILTDLNTLNYPIELIQVNQIGGLVQMPVLILNVKEKDLNCNTVQNHMSQGMYRAIALLIIVEKFIANIENCTILIDDLGEGLDFERSKKLTKLLFEKTKDRNMQLIIASNDRFLINTVDIKKINFLERTGHFVKAYNYENSKELFDEFQLTGLNNFDFFSDQIFKN